MNTTQYATILCALALTTGCVGPRDSADTAGLTTIGTITTTAATTSGGSTSADSDGSASDSESGGTGDKFDVAGGTGATTTDGVSTGECAEVIEEADIELQPADIIIVIDNSQSMSNEISSVQANMNAFSTQIANAAVDPHVIMISGYEHNSDSGICVPPPLGSGGRPQTDHNPFGYWHVGNWVGSNSALQRVVSHYNDYKPALRPNASVHILVVTDDNSDWSPAQFDTMFKALDANFGDYVLHAIINGSGATYSALAAQTGGLVGDINQAQYQPIFDELANNVVETATLSCEYDIPEPGNGELFDQDKVNVEFDDGMGGTLEIGYVESETDCAGVMDGWYYDNPLDPNVIHLCPQTCEGIQGFMKAKISVIFGCDTIPAG